MRDSHRATLCYHGRGGQHSGQSHPLGRAEAGAGIPSRRRGIGAVIASGDVVEGAGGAVEGGVDEANRRAARLVEPRDQPGP